jgi:hypothetical protein
MIRGSLLKLCGGLAALALTACQPGESIVERIQLDVPRDNVFDFEIEFKPEVEMNMELQVPIKNYGAIRFGPGRGPGLMMGAYMDLSVLQDNDIVFAEKTRRLPNGQPMSHYVSTDLSRLYFEINENVTMSFYIGPNIDHLYFGTALQLSFIDEDFPTGFYITQWIYDTERRPVAIATFFGPDVENDELVSPGGFFVMTNITDLIDYYGEQRLTSNIAALEQPHHILLAPRAQTYINSEPVTNLRQRQDIERLWAKFQTKAREAGMAD